MHSLLISSSLSFPIDIVARGNTYTTRPKDQNAADTNISASGDWAQDESLVGLLAQNPFFNDDTVSGQI